jgi:hypothetical protein
MILISHRGNIDGPNPMRENSIDYILEALNLGFNVEVDLWFDNGIYLGHDNPQYKIDIEFLYKKNLWIHCKNIEALDFCKNHKIKNNYFYHQNDDVTLTSNGFLWTNPGQKLTKYSIAVMPEIKTFNEINISYAICSDFVKKYQI